MPAQPARSSEADPVTASGRGAPTRVPGQAQRAAPSNRRGFARATVPVADAATKRAAPANGTARCRDGRYSAATMTGMPIDFALSTRLAVMPEPGKAMTPLGSRFSSSSLRRNGAARP